MAGEKGDEFRFPDEGGEKKADDKEQKFEIVEEGDEEIKVEVVDDTPEADRGRKAVDAEDVTDAELAAYSEKVQTRIKALDHARHDERRGREAAERERAELERVARGAMAENERLKQFVDAGSKVHKSTLEAAAASKQEIAKKELLAAHEAYDNEAIVAAQQKLSEATWELADAKKFVAPPLQRVDERVQSQHVQGEKGSAVSPETARWQAKNQWFGVNSKMTALALAAHEEAVGEGIQPDTDKYFQRLDAEVRKAFPDAFVGEKKPDGEQPRRKPASVVASSTRSSGPKRIVVTKTQVAVAKKLGVPLESYVKEMQKLESQNG